jgi:hypothetical protein
MPVGNIADTCHSQPTKGRQQQSCGHVSSDFHLYTNNNKVVISEDKEKFFVCIQTCYVARVSRHTRFSLDDLKWLAHIYLLHMDEVSVKMESDFAFTVM